MRSDNGIQLCPERGLIERDTAIEARSLTLAVEAASKQHPWASKLGRPPTDPARRADWLRAAATLAAYRERWSVTSVTRPLGSLKSVTTVEQYGQYKRAPAALQRAIDLSRGPRSVVNDNLALAATVPRPEPQNGVEL